MTQVVTTVLLAKEIKRLQHDPGERCQHISLFLSCRRMELMQAFDFTPADMDANRHGYMTKEQRIKLRRRYKLSLRGIVFPVVPLIGVVLAPLLACLWPDKTAMCLVTLSTVAVLLLLFIVGYLLNYRDAKRDLYKGFVSTVCGQMFLDMPEREMESEERAKSPWHISNASYALEVNGIRFFISKRQWQTLVDKEHRPFCVYYAPNSKTILSVEELS